MKNSDKSAMPTQSNGGDIFGGLTKREMMAMHILSGLLSDYEFDVTRQMAAEIAVQQADALLDELEKSQ